MNLFPYLLFPLAIPATDWEPRNNGLGSLFIVAITIDATAPDRLYCTVRGQGIYRSTDAGTTWRKHGSGIPDWGPPYGHLLHHGVAISSSDPFTLWAVAADLAVHPNLGYIYKSDDGGITWRRSSNGTTAGGWSGIVGVIQVPGEPLHLYAGTIVTGAAGGLFESTDGGATWQNIAGSATGRRVSISAITIPIHLSSASARAARRARWRSAKMRSGKTSCMRRKATPASWSTNRYAPLHS